jgi:hypothetical protein
LNTLHKEFTEHLLKWQNQPFAMSTADCVAFTVDWIDAQRGTKLAARIGSEFRCLPFRELRTLVETDRLKDEVIKVLGEPRQDSRPHLGDVVLYHNGVNRITLGLAGEDMVYGPDRHGLSGLLLKGRQMGWWPLAEIV